MTYKSPVVAQPDYVDNAITTVAGVRDRLRDHGEPQPDLGQRWSGLGLGGFGQPGGQFASSSTVGAAANGHELVALEVDHCVSGKSLDRREARRSGDRERIASAILSGCQVILLDNLHNELASSTLESILTEGTATIRQFGKLGADITVPFAGLVIVTANNAALRADMLRRMLPIRIVIDTDEPEKREFGFDPYLEAKRDRLQILAAAFTILRAWRNSGEKATQTLGSFERWAELVAGAVQWLTGINPISLIEERKAEDPKRADERQVIAGLYALFREQKFTSKEAVGNPARRDFVDNSEIPATGLDPELWRVVLEFKGDRPTPIAVGCWLREHKDKVFGDLRLTSQPDRDKKAQWSVLKRPSAGDAGDCGGYLTPTRAISGTGAAEGQGSVIELREGQRSPAIPGITRTDRAEPEVGMPAKRSLF